MSPPESPSPPPRSPLPTVNAHPVVVVGTGLIGTSIALALRRRNPPTPVFLVDRDPAVARRAAALGAGTVAPAPAATPLVVLAVPPAAVPAALLAAQRRHPRAACTDVSSAQADTQARAKQAGCDLRRFVGGHPMAGREVSGPQGARADLFDGKTWVLVPSPETAPEVVEQGSRLARQCGARPVRRTAQEHDAAVALVSHAPQVVASAMAARLADADAAEVELAGAGVRDLTRVAASDPGLWTDILQANAGPVADVLDAVAGDLSRASAALRRAGSADIDAVADLLRRGNAGRRRLLP